MTVESTTVGGELFLTIGGLGGDDFHATLAVFGEFCFEYSLKMTEIEIEAVVELFGT